MRHFSKNRENIQPLAGFFPRFVGFLLDLAFSQIALDLLLSSKRFQAYYDSSYRFLTEKDFLSILGSPNVLSSILLLLLLMQMMKFYCNLILGVSLGQWIMGIRGEGGILWSRFGGSARVILSTILTPLLIFEIPCLLGKRTLKETLSQTRLIRGKNFFLFDLFRLITIPVILLFAVYSPLLWKLALFDGTQVSFSDVKKASPKNNSNSSLNKSYSSNRFRFSTMSSHDDNDFILIPSFEITKIKGHKKVKPILVIYDKTTKKKGQLKIVSRFSLLKLLNKTRQGDFFFSRRFPELNRILNLPIENFEKKDFQVKKTKKDLLNPLAVEEIEDYVRSSFELDLGSLFQHTLKYGPFIRGYVFLRYYLVGKLKAGSTSDVDLAYLGDKKFLRSRQTLNDDTYIESYYPLHTNNAILLEISWDQNIIKRLEVFKDSFFSSMKWHLDYNNIFSFPKTKENLDTLTILDFFIQNKVSSEDVGKLEESVYHQLFELGRTALNDDDSVLKKIVDDQLSFFEQVAKLKNRQAKGHFSQKFFDFLKEMKVALKSKDMEYFNLL